MTETKVINRDTVQMTKDGITILIVHVSRRTMIVNVTKRCVPYVYEGETVKHAYEKYLHLLGKMLLKYPDSKYFGNPKYEESGVNGHPGTAMKGEWESYAFGQARKYGFEV